MSEKFNGFSQDEINKVSGTRSKVTTDIVKKEGFRSQHVGIRRMPEKWSKLNTENPKKQQVNRIQKKTTTNMNSSVTKSTGTTVSDQEQQDITEEVNLDRSLSKSLEEALFYQPMKAASVSNDMEVLSKDNGVTSKNGVKSTCNYSSILKLPPPPTNLGSDVSSSTNASETIDNTSILPTQQSRTVGAVLHTELNLDSPFKGISLKDFETHRKLIEEQNKQKKEMLYKAIEHHSQKTAAEARKIADIKSELLKLDNDLAVDVAILRKQIDNACVQFANIEKQYIKIEAQFLKAKLDLHNAAEKKELLTEHLCTLIAHNEDRKAQKLSELMQKVGLTPSGDYNVSSTSGNDASE